MKSMTSAWNGYETRQVLVINKLFYFQIVELEVKENDSSYIYPHI